MSEDLNNFEIDYFKRKKIWSGSAMYLEEEAAIQTSDCSLNLDRIIFEANTEQIEMCEKQSRQVLKALFDEEGQKKCYLACENSTRKGSVLTRSILSTGSEQELVDRDTFHRVPQKRVSERHRNRWLSWYRSCFGAQNIASKRSVFYEMRRRLTSLGKMSRCSSKISMPVSHDTEFSRELQGSRYNHSCLIHPEADVSELLMGSSSEYFLKNVSDSSESDEETKQFTDLEAIIPEARKYKEKPIKMRRQLPYPKVSKRKIRKIITDKKKEPHVTIQKWAPIKFWNPLKPGMSVYLPPPLLLPAKKATISTKDQSSSSSSEEESIFALIQRMMARPSLHEKQKSVIPRRTKLRIVLCKKNKSVQTAISCIQEIKESWPQKMPVIHPDWMWWEFESGDSVVPRRIMEELLYKHGLSSCREYDEESRLIARKYHAERKAIYDKYHIHELGQEEVREFITDAEPRNPPNKLQLTRYESLKVLNTLIANKPKLEGGDWINEKWEKYFDSNIDVNGPYENGTFYFFLKNIQLEPETQSILRKEFYKPHLFVMWEFLESSTWPTFSPIKAINKLTFNCLSIYSGPITTEFLHYIAKHRHPIIIYAFGGDHVCRPVARSNLLLYNSLFNVGEKCYINIKFKGTFGLECNGVIEGWIKLEGDSFKIYSYLETKRKKHYKTCDIRRYIFINSEINGQCTTDSIFQPSTLGSLVNRSNEESTPESTDKLLEESEKVDIGFRSSKIYKSRELLGLSHDLNVTNSNADVLPGNISIVEEYSGHTLTEMLFAKVPDLRNLIPQNWDIVRFLIVLWEMDVRDFLELLSVIKSEEHADSKHVEESSLKCEESASGELRKDASQLAQESSAPAETEPNAGSSTVTDSSSFHRMVFERQRSKSAHIKPFYFGGFAEFSFSQLVQQFAKTDRSLLDVTAESSVIKNTLSESEMVEAKWDVAAFAVAVWEMALPEICVLLKILAEDLKSPLDKIYRSKPHHEFKFRDDSWMNPPLPTSGKLSIQERQVRGQWKEKRKEAKLQKKKEKLLKKLEIQKRADPTLPTANLTSSSAFSSFILSRSSSKVVSCWKESSSQDKPPEETLPETWGRRDTRIKCGERVIEDSGTAHEVYPSRSWLLKAGNTQASFSLSSVSLFGNARHSPTDDWMEPDELIYGRRRSSVSSGRIHRDSRVLFEAEAEYWTPDQRKKPLDMNDNVKRTLFCECCDVATGTFEHDTENFFCPVFHRLYLWKLKYWRLVMQTREETPLVVEPTILCSPAANRYHYINVLMIPFMCNKYKNDYKMHWGHPTNKRAKKFSVYMNGRLALERLRLFEVILFGGVCKVDNRVDSELKVPKMMKNVGSPTARGIRHKRTQVAYNPQTGKRWPHSLFGLSVSRSAFSSHNVEPKEITIEIEYLILNDTGKETVYKHRYPLLFVEFEFLGHAMESKSRYHEGLKCVFNYKKHFYVPDSRKSRERKMLFKALIEKNKRPLKLNICSEPMYESSLEKCEQIGCAEVNLRSEMVDKRSDIIRKKFPVMCTNCSMRFPIGALVITVTGHRIMRSALYGTCGLSRLSVGMSSGKKGVKK